MIKIIYLEWPNGGISYQEFTSTNNQPVLDYKSIEIFNKAIENEVIRQWWVEDYEN